ncbi:hypothetical protein K504DRAFT_367201 [Pleomassaria siparia CBS 279.74]|uniref:RFX-type winged-helix domain-containing protein n=1 Tax=Pleomassaria siparia CBS 279.74 TaxID=1314801 RepID=A0A6G1KSS7_9PLEO|nr:hypothetical protein K504DRAFT_367201 [Pleomassaria siparia CBS 279.74]
MATHDRCSRSDTSMSVRSNRPLSRASTASIHSFDHHGQPHNAQFQQHPPQQNSYTQYNSGYTPLEPILQAAHHVGQQEAMPMEAVQQLMGYAPDSAPNSAHPNVINSHPFDHNHGLQIAMNLPQQYPSGPAPEEKKKKGSGSGAAATNDHELRELLSRNQTRELQEVAREVVATDRTSKSEKIKQLFAMLWLKKSCQKSGTSTPRNRVYSKYADRCATERVIPLNPASFGKLVRVCFPDIRTRRLGVRGESKYHYVDLALVNDTDDSSSTRRPATATSRRHGLSRQNSMAPSVDFNSVPRIPTDTASFPQQDQAFQSNGGYNAQGSSKGLLFTNIYDKTYRPNKSQTTSFTYEYELKFPTPEQLNAQDDPLVSLPDITPYLPSGTDPDMVGALVAVYRTHCTSLIDAMRFCKEKQFFRLFNSFHGTLTLPVQRLFAQAEIAPWIKECDWMMYQKMMHNISRLALQLAPPPVLKFLDTVSKTLHGHLLKVFNALPSHVLEAKLEPATVFAHLLRKVLRVNSAAHAASAMLMPDENRNKMWADWVAYVNLKHIIEDQLPPSCGHEQVYNILKTEMRGLLGPLKSEMWLPNGAIYREDQSNSNDVSTDTVIDRIAAFLTNIPLRFPHAPARTLLHCINALGTAALREMTVENGESFQGWWLTHVFISEMAQWLASYGGFLSHTAPNWNAVSYSAGLMNTGMANGSGSNNESRYSSIDADFGPTQSFIADNNVHMQDTGNSNPGIHDSRRTTQQYEPLSFNLEIDLQTSQQEANLDDSGIGLLEDGLESKFSSNMHQLQNHLSQISSVAS